MSISGRVVCIKSDAMTVVYVVKVPIALDKLPTFRIDCQLSTQNSQSQSAKTKQPKPNPLRLPWGGVVRLWI